MDDMQILHDLLNNKALVPLEKEYKRYKVTLTEMQSPDSCVEIRGIPDNTIILKIDRFPDPSAIFKGNNGECKRADYAIITSYNGKKRNPCQ